jgi:hypothetical protein
MSVLNASRARESERGAAADSRTEPNSAAPHLDNPSTIRSARGCQPCLSYVPSPMSSGWTTESVTYVSGINRNPCVRNGPLGAGGGSGIRTHDTVSRIHAFQACAFSHSAIPPANGAGGWQYSKGESVTTGGPPRQAGGGGVSLRGGMQPRPPARTAPAGGGAAARACRHGFLVISAHSRYEAAACGAGGAPRLQALGIVSWRR